MFRNQEDAGLFQTFSKKIQKVEALQAYRYLVGWGLASSEYTCFPKPQGYLDSVRFYRGNSWDFAFIPNQKWLTFYFRRPCFSLPKYATGAILKRFPDAEETSENEFIVRLSTLQSATQIVVFVES